MIKPRNAAILQENCLRCHGDFVHDIVARQHDRRGRACSAFTAIAASGTERGDERAR